MEIMHEGVGDTNVQAGLGGVQYVAKTINLYLGRSSPTPSDDSGGEDMFSDPQWEKALSLYRRSLTGEEFDQVTRNTTMDDAEFVAKLIQHRDGSSDSVDIMSMLTPFFTRLKDMIGVLGLFASSRAEKVDIAFGSVIFALELASRKRSESIELVEMFITIGEYLPQFDKLPKLAPQNPRLRKSLILIYCDIVAFCAKANQFYKSHDTINKIWALAGWTLPRDFKEALAMIKEHRQSIQDEALSMRMEKATAIHRDSPNHLGTIPVARNPEGPAASYGLIPYPPNTRFRCRGDILKSIHRNLAATEVVKPGRSQRSVALHGLGGVGKTQLALKSVYDYQASYTAIFWISADSESKLSEGYSEIASLLRLEASKLSDQNEIVKEVKRWLRSNSDAWLMVFDNADNLECLRKFWPPPAAKSFVLMTTRDQTASRSPAEVGIHVTPFGVDDAVEVFFSLLGRPNPDPSPPDSKLIHRSPAGSLVLELGMLPLAISQAAAFIARVGCSIENYLEMYKDADSPSRFLNSDKDTNFFYENTVATTWNISFSRIEQHHPESADLLRILAFLDPDGVPESLFHKAKSAMNSDDPRFNFLLDRTLYNNAIGGLTQLSLMHRQSDTLYVHRIVQEVTLQRMDVTSLLSAYQAAASLVWTVFPSSTGSSLWPHWSEASRYLSQALRLELHHRKLPQSSRLRHVGDLFRECGKYERDRGLFDQSIRFLQLATTLCEQQNGKENLDTAMCHYALGRSLLDAMRLAEAIDSFRTAGETQERILGRHHRTTANTFNDMGIAYHEAGDLDEAEKWYRYRLGIYVDLLGEDDPFTVSSYNNLALVALARGKSEKAVAYTRRSLAAQLKAFKPDHPYLPKTRNYLAYCLRATGQLEEAAGLHRQAAATQETLLGPRHVNTVTSLQGLADVLHDQGNVEEAIDLYYRITAVREESLGHHHPAYIGASRNLLLLLCKSGQLDDASTYLRRIVDNSAGNNTSQMRQSIEELLSFGRQLIARTKADPQISKDVPLEGRYVQHQH